MVSGCRRSGNERNGLLQKAYPERIRKATRRVRDQVLEARIEIGAGRNGRKASPMRIVKTFKPEGVPIDQIVAHLATTQAVRAAPGADVPTRATVHPEDPEHAELLSHAA